MDPRAFFGAHAEAYSQSPSHRSGKDLEALVLALQPRSWERALDVATGPGHVARALAHRLRAVVGVDLTPAMEPVFVRNAKEEGLHNLVFRVAPAEALPFPDQSFDLVSCRRAAHHFEDLTRALGEMRRVLRPGGRLGLVDMVAPGDPEGARWLNDLERARDPSHREALAPSEWQRWIEEQGFWIERFELLEEPMEFARWLAPREEAPEVMELLTELPRRVRELLFVGPLWRKTRMLLVAHRLP